VGGTQQLARLAGGLAGLGLAFAAAAPFSGLPPQGVSGKLAPAQIEVRAVANAEFDVSPVGTVLEGTDFPASGAPGGPAFKLRLVNRTPLPQRLSIRLTSLSPTLDDAVLVRASGAGAVLIDGPLKTAGAWSLPAGVVSPGESTTVRFRFKLKKGLADDLYRGRLDIRQFELEGEAVRTPEEQAAADEVLAEEAAADAARATTPAGRKTPSGNASAAVLPATTPGSTTP
jgi:hypothetical protein